MKARLQREARAEARNLCDLLEHFNRLSFDYTEAGMDKRLATLDAIDASLKRVNLLRERILKCDS